MRIAYAATYDSRNHLYWSGTGYHIANALAQQGAEVDHLGPLHDELNLLLRAKIAYYRRVGGKEYQPERSPAVLRGYARQVASKLRDRPADVVVAPGTFAIAHLDCPTPTVFWTDCCFAGMLGFYADYSRLCAETLRDGHAAEQAALDRCAMAVYTTTWAAESTLQHYKVAREKVHVVPLGANLQRAPEEAAVRAYIASRPASPCRLLFIGRIWSRKRGRLAVEVAQRLNDAGLPTVLTLAGGVPDDGLPLPPFVTSLGFINKGTPEGREQFERLLATSHFLIVPSLAEAYGLVYCEASAYGVPSLATAVGGVPDIVVDGRNGRAFPAAAPAADYAAYVLQTMADYRVYQDLAHASYHEFRTRLNWDVAGRQMMALLRNVVPGK